MTTAYGAPTDSDSSSLALAHLDAQDTSYILPIREYLETHGVEVAVNRQPDSLPMYHIVCGDTEFVKEIFLRKEKSASKRLGIIVDNDIDWAPAEGQLGKIIFTDPVPLTPSQVTDMFEYFFIGDKNVLDMRRRATSRKLPVDNAADEESAVSKREIHVSHAKERETQDTDRIETIIADVFGKNSSSSPANKGKHRRHKKIRQFLGAMIIAAGVIVIPLLWYLMSLAASGASIVFSARSLAGGHADAAQKYAGVSSYWNKQAKAILSVAAWPLTVIKYQDLVRGQERLLSCLSDAQSAIEGIASLSGTAMSVAAGLLNQVDVTSTGTTPASDITALRNSLAWVGNMLGLTQAELAQLLHDRTFPFTISLFAQQGSRAVGELSALRESASDTDKLLSLFLRLAGFREPKTYLILLQNSMELRPTGGFIGSVALASFESGRLTNLEIQDVYTYDGQLKGHVDPPLPIRELLGQEHWYLRDSNWDPDFPSSATRARWFFEKESGKKVDGVFALSTPFIIELLKATGPLELTDYNERISADNFYGKALYYTQNDFFPGSTQKKDFLGSLTRTLITKITSGKDVNTTKLFRALTMALRAHDFLMMFEDPEAQSLIGHYGWAGGVPSAGGCTGVDPATCMFHPTAMVEANLGVNKVNSFITRTIDREISITPGAAVSESFTVTIRNGSPAGEQGMPYRTYVRFIFPPRSLVGQVLIDGESVVSRTGTKATPPPYVEKSDSVSGNFTLGVALDIPAATEKKISITYAKDAPLNFGPEGTTLDVFNQKQPGVTDTPVHTTIRYPAQWTAGILEERTGGGQDFVANPGQLEYNTILTRDELTRVRLIR